MPWGSPIRAEQIDARLSTGLFDTLTLIHNETSTGTMSPLAEIAALKAKHPDVMFIVDAVSSMTAVPLGFDALGSKLDEFFAEGLEARYARHAETNQMLRDWIAKHGFTLFPEPEFSSKTLVCVNNGARPGSRVVDAAKLQKLVKDQGILIDGGYGKIKGTTFRISNMGDETPETIGALIAVLDKAMAQL